jgi:hypothetical protein
VQNEVQVQQNLKSAFCCTSCAKVHIEIFRYMHVHNIESVESFQILEKARFARLREGTQYSEYLLFVTRLLDAVGHHQRRGGRRRSYRGTRPLYAIKSTTSSVKAQRASIRRTSTKPQEGSEVISTSLPTSTVGYSTT